MYVYVGVCLSGSQPLCLAFLLSFQAYPTSYCTVLLILCECISACSGHCKSTRLLPHIHSTAGQLLPHRPAQTQLSFTLRRSEHIFLLTENCKIKPKPDLTMTDTSTVKCKQSLIGFAECTVLWLLNILGCQSGKFQSCSFSTSSALLELTLSWHCTLLIQ